MYPQISPIPQVEEFVGRVSLANCFLVCDCGVFVAAIPARTDFRTNHQSWCDLRGQQGYIYWLEETKFYGSEPRT